VGRGAQVSGRVRLFFIAEEVVYFTRARATEHLGAWLSGAGSTSLNASRGHATSAAAGYGQPRRRHYLPKRSAAAPPSCAPPWRRS